MKGLTFNFSQGEGVNLSSFFAVLSFEVRANPFAGIGSVGGEKLDRLEMSGRIGMVQYQIRNYFKILGMIGGGTQLAVGG